MTNQPNIRKPKNSFEIFKWLIFEPILLQKYSDSLNWRERLREFLKAYTWVVVLAIFIYCASIFFKSAFDLPILYKNASDSEIVNNWPVKTDLLSKFLFILKTTIGRLAFGLAVGLTGGLAGGFARGLSFGFAVGFAGGIPYGLGVGFAIGLAVGIALGLATKLTRGVAEGAGIGSIFGLWAGLLWGIINGIFFELTNYPNIAYSIDKLTGRHTEILSITLHNDSLVLILMIMICFYLSYFRIIPFYMFFVVKSWFAYDLLHNPYHRDGMIWLPIPGLKSKLVRHTSENPEEASRFIDFLLEYRPLQKNLAMHLSHAAAAARWRLHPLDADILKKIPLISSDNPKLKPSDQWFQTITNLREELLASQQQSSIGLKMQYFERFQTQLEHFREITLKKESSLWNHYYLDTLTEWQQHARGEYDNLQLTAQSTEPVTRNRYRAGDALNPQFDRLIFMERDDLKDSLQQKILTSPQMPLFLIHGQRRVGKTSLLKFLPLILGPRFKVVFLDLQNLDNVNQWLTDIQHTFHESLELPVPEPLPGTGQNWSQAWKALQSQLETAAAQKEYKIILAFDEYEKLHRRLQTDPAAAADLLDAMRSFSQHQNKIVFLFVGATFFSELDRPRWSDYFVQAVLLEVDYLTAPQTRRLIEVAGLDYPDEVIERIYYLTQGHPTLVQRICHEMVNIANTALRRHMTPADLDHVLETHVYRPQNGVTDVFWRQFCEKPALKQAVREVLAGTAPTDKKALFALREHGFILPEKDLYRIRVPIFQTWVEKFGEAIT